MRVLFTSPAGLGHVHSMVPLALSHIARGHDVLWATPADGVGPVERAGIRAVATGPAGLTRPADVMRRYPEFKSLPPQDIPDVLFAKLFGESAAPAILTDLVPVAHDWRPDLVVADAAEFAGHIVAAELGVPSVTKGFGPILPERKVAAAAAEVAALWRSRGLEPRPFGGSYDHLYLDVYPPELGPGQPPYITHLHRLRPVSYGGSLETGSPPMPEVNTEAPLVYVTMGTVFNNPELMTCILAALADLPVRVFATVGPDIDPTVVGPQPPHIRVEQYVPQTALLPLCDIVVSHAGSGTVLAALAIGLPQLCLPQGADQFVNAAAISAVGAGISLVPADAIADRVQGAVCRLVAEPSFRKVAGCVSDSIAAMPSPDDVAALLETL